MTIGQYKHQFGALQTDRPPDIQRVHCKNWLIFFCFFGCSFLANFCKVLIFFYSFYHCVKIHEFTENLLKSRQSSKKIIIFSSSRVLFFSAFYREGKLSFTKGRFDPPYIIPWRTHEIDVYTFTHFLVQI